MKQRAILDVVIRRDKGDVIFNMVFLDTGEIRQKRRSLEWCMKRIFFYELRTWKKRGETVEYDKER